MQKSSSNSGAVRPVVLATDNGTHSPEKWAHMVSQFVFPISVNIDPAKYQPARDAQLKIANTLEAYIDGVLCNEKVLLKVDPDRVCSLYDGHKYVDDAVELLYKITDQTEWAKYMRDNEELVRMEFVRHFNSMQQVERSYHLDTQENTINE